MGWDAFAIPLEIQYHLGEPHFKEPEIVCNPKAKKAFEKASRRVNKLCGSVDGYLSHGALDVSDCGEALSKATGETVYPPGETQIGGWDWSPEKVKILYKGSLDNWDRITGIEPMYIHSAKEFLRVCAELNLGIKFSY